MLICNGMKKQAFYLGDVIFIVTDSDILRFLCLFEIDTMKSPSLQHKMKVKVYVFQIEIDTLRAQLNKVKVKLGIIEEDKDTVEAKSRGLKVCLATLIS